MKAFIKFDLSDPSDRADYKLVNMAGEMSSALFEIDEYCRGILKHGTPNKETIKHLEAVREFIRDLPLDR